MVKLPILQSWYIVGLAHSGSEPFIYTYMHAWIGMEVLMEQNSQLVDAFPN